MVIGYVEFGGCVSLWNSLHRRQDVVEWKDNGPDMTYSLQHVGSSAQPDGCGELVFGAYGASRYFSAAIHVLLSRVGSGLCRSVYSTKSSVERLSSSI